MKKTSITFTTFLILALLSGCQASDVGALRQKLITNLNSSIGKDDGAKLEPTPVLTKETPSLKMVMNTPAVIVDLDKSFVSSLKSSVKLDPKIIASEQRVQAQISSLNSLKAKKDFQVSSSIYGGIEDVSDRTNGVALVLDASRLLFDGGLVDSQILSAEFEVDAAKYELKTEQDESVHNSALVWVELERYESLNQLIESRLNVLQPLITQLEKVAEAGIGDVSKVASAQRTVSTILVAQSDVLGGLKQARINFLNVYGSLPKSNKFDSSLISELTPSNITDNMIQEAPTLLAQYSKYRAAEASLVSAKSQSEFNVGFQARLSRPFGGSGYDSDESIGLVAKKILSNGRKFESDIKQAEAVVFSRMAELQAIYREGERAVQSARETIVRMNDAISLARESAKVTSDEIAYLRQQLVIGGSTLESVLSAEARLYDAEAKEINFLSNKRAAQLAILEALGLLSLHIGL